MKRSSSRCMTLHWNMPTKAIAAVPVNICLLYSLIDLGMFMKLRHQRPEEVMQGCSPSLKTLCKEGSSPCPRHDAMQHALGYHPHWSIVHLSKGNSNLEKKALSLILRLMRLYAQRPSRNGPESLMQALKPLCCYSVMTLTHAAFSLSLHSLGSLRI